MNRILPDRSYVIDAAGCADLQHGTVDATDARHMRISGCSGESIAAGRDIPRKCQVSASISGSEGCRILKGAQKGGNYEKKKKQTD